MFSENVIDRCTYPGSMENRIIQGLFIFKDLDDSETQFINAILQEKEYAPDEVIYKEGDMGDSLNIIVKGKVRINRSTVGGDQFCLATLRAGDIFGTMSFLDGSRHDATIVSDQTTQLLILERSDFDRLSRSSPVISDKVLRRLSMHLASIVRNMNSQYMDLMNLMFRKGK